MIYKFKNLEEGNKKYLEYWLGKGKKLEELDSYEAMRIRVRAYASGIYKFKTMKEKEKDTVIRVIKAYDARASC